MPDSTTTSAIKKVSKIIGGKLKTLDFARRVPHFFRQSGDLFHCIHFQASRWNTQDSGSFTINLTITSASLFRYWTGRSLPANPTTTSWPIQQRLGFLCPERKDLWWHVSNSTDISYLSEEVVHHLQEYGLAFFQRFPSSSEILRLVDCGITPPGMTNHQKPLLHAMLLTDLGKKEDALNCIEAALVENRSALFRETILKIAYRLDLPVAGTI